MRDLRKENTQKLRMMLIRMWRRQRKSFTGWLVYVKKYGLLQEALDQYGLMQLLQKMIDSEDADWSEIFYSILEGAVDDAALALATELGIEPSFINFPVSRVLDKLKGGTLDLVRGINETTRNVIRRIVEDGIENHKSYGEVAREIRRRFIAFGQPATQEHIRDRATLIAVDAIGQAYTDAQKEVAKALIDNGLAMEKKWEDVGDDRVEEECRNNSEEGWIPSGQEFSSGHDTPLAHPGCRCALLWRIARD